MNSSNLAPAAGLALAAMLLGACQTTSVARSPATDASELVDPKDDFGEAVMQPFTDFNITRDPIPAQLQAAAKGPYAVPADASCETLARQVRSLDSALGPDLDAPRTDEAGGVDASSFAAGALRSLTTGWIPFRGVVRRLTGAEAHAREAREAILAGAVRRAYLMGLGERSACVAPAAPRRP